MKRVFNIFITNTPNSVQYRRILEEEIEDEIEDMLSEETGLTELERILAPEFRFIIEADNRQPDGGDTTIGLTTTASVDQTVGKHLNTPRPSLKLLWLRV